ncbi:tetratricopeptide repeat protein [Edaphobacter aggregans]|uniref:tetratricopeptide repeat protein n=1 Tax=Edaphobacter aggregans TaxID=570835 RepID=UPI0005532839|nr:tetratricopeptide repeat protein [Edaphobacter aggregans]
MAFPLSPSFLRLTILLGMMLALPERLFADDAQAEALLKQGRVDEAAAMLKRALTTDPHDARAHQLLCRVDYAQEIAEPAVRECEQATQEDPSNSDYQMWLGRAYGLKASQAHMIVAFGLAKKVHLAFERAIQLNPANVTAMSDLGHFYVDAPAIVGGGLDKAETLAPQLMASSPARGHWLLAMIAKKKNDMATAESEFKSAVAAGKTPEAWVDLGLFYQQTSQYDKAVAALDSSVDANRTKNAALVDAASILTEMHRQADLSERLLRDYLASPAKSDDAPAFKVHQQLGKLLAQRGDTPGAQREYVAAAALAPNYAPARKAAQGM